MIIHSQKKELGIRQKIIKFMIKVKNKLPIEKIKESFG